MKFVLDTYTLHFVYDDYDIDIVEKNVEQYAEIYEEKYHLPFD